MLTRHLLRLLELEALHCAVVNRHTEPSASSSLHAAGCIKLEGLPLTCFLPPSASPDATNTNQPRIPPSPRTRDGLLFYYALNASSVLPVLALDLQSRDSVLDLCAAPGGKTFAILQLISLEGGLATNDPSPARMRRLRSVVKACIPSNLQSCVRFTRRRGEEWGEIERDAFDKVLVDAPCSSERYNIRKWAETGKEYPDSVNFSSLQTRLLIAGLHALKRGGVLVYSTCTMAERENDGVLKKARALAKNGKAPNFDCFSLSGTGGLEALEGVCHLTNTEYGVLVVPDNTSNCGPTYIAKLRKL